MADIKLDNIQKFLEFADKNFVSPKEVLAMGTSIINVIKQVKSNLEETIDKNDLKNIKELGQLSNELNSILGQAKSLTSASKNDLISILDGKLERLNNTIEDVRSLILSLPDYSWVDNKLLELEALIKGINYTSQDVRDKLESLEGDERLSVDAIKGLEELLKKYSSSNKQTVGFGGIANRDFIKDLDISSQLDGVTTTFSIPAVYNIISVHLSSFPHALRKNVDFTYTSTTITFTSEIDPSVTLATGQTCVLTVVTA